MGLFNLFPLQVQTATPSTPPQPNPTPGPGSTPPPTAGSSGTQTTPSGPTTPGGPTTPSGQPAASPRPATPTPPTTSSDSSTPPSTSLSGDTASVYVAPFLGYGWRGFGNNTQDTHEGFQLGFTVGYPTLQMGPNFSLRPELLYRHEWMGRSIPAEMGQGIESSADIDVLGIGARFGWRPHPLFEASAGFNLGAAHVGARATMDGRQGLRYHDNRFAYSADNWGFNVEGSLRLGIPEQRLADWFSLGGGAQGYIGYTGWDLTPDSISRPPSDPAIPVNSVGGGVLFYLTGRFGSVGSEPSRERDSSGEARPRTPQTASTPETPPAQTTPQTTAPTPTPTATPAAQSTPRVDRVSFNVTPGPNGSVQAVNSPANFTTFFNGVTGSDAVRQAIAQAGSTGFTLNLRVRYSSQTRGTLEVESIQIGDHTYQNGHFPADMAVSSTAIQGILQTVVQQGLPGYTGNRQQPLRVQITHTAPASTSPAPTPTAVAGQTSPQPSPS